jgi:hypothetical protein
MTGAGFVPIVTTLRRLLTEPVAARPGERCDVCRAPLSDEHLHGVDLRSRRLLCVCGICGTLGGRYRVVPNRYVHMPSMRVSRAQWDALAIPVDLVSLFFNSNLGRWIACYPGPAGAVESLLPLEAWPLLVEANPWIGALAPDVEALLVRRTDQEYPCFIAPITACYELAGRIRSSWTGLNGGERVRDEIDRFFAALLERSTSSSSESSRCREQHLQEPA